MTELSSSAIARIDKALAGVARGDNFSAGINWDGRLPDALLYVWANYGHVRLADGRLRLIDPDALRPLITYLVEEDTDFRGDTHAIGLGALGEVVVWSERHGIGLLTWPLSTLQMTYMMDKNPPSADEQIVTDLLTLPPEVLDTTGPDGNLIHDRVRDLLGPLERLEIYGATPVPPEPGQTPVDHYIIADAMEWLEANYTQISVDLVDWDSTPATLRTLGQPWPNGRPSHFKEVTP